VAAVKLRDIKNSFAFEDKVARLRDNNTIAQVFRPRKRKYISKALTKRFFEL
jgi:hypothetical protein